MNSKCEPWDVLVSLADLTFALNSAIARNEGQQQPTLSAPLPPPYVHQNAPYAVTLGELHWWWECVSETHVAAERLILACEELIDANIDDSRLNSLKLAVAQAQGLSEYCKLEDR